MRWGFSCGGLQAGNGPLDVRHIMLGSLAHVGHVGACIPEAQAYVFFHGHAVPLIGHLVRGGEAPPPNKGIVKHQDPEASWMGLPLARHVSDVFQKHRPMCCFLALSSPS